MGETKQEREMRTWTIFGQHNDGTVNITDGVNNQLFEHLHPEQAKGICWARKVCLTRIKNILAGKSVTVSGGNYG